MDAIDQLGPIRPEHATDGWRLEGDDLGRWRLVKHFGSTQAMIVPTSAAVVAWTILEGGKVIRAASEQHVDAAKSAAAEWIAKQR